MKFQSLCNGGQQEPSLRSQEDMGPRGNQTTITPHGAPLVQTEALLCPESQPTPSSYLMPQLKEKPRWKCQIRSAHISRLTWQTWTHVPHMQRTAPCITAWLVFCEIQLQKEIRPSGVLSQLEVLLWKVKWTATLCCQVTGEATSPWMPVKRQYSQCWAFPSWMDINSCIHFANVLILRNLVKTHFLSTSIWKACVLLPSFTSGIALGTTL